MSPARYRPAARGAEALAFLTVLGRPAAPTPGALAWFGPVGVLVGVAVGLTWWGASTVWPPLLAAGLALSVDLLLTGMLHLDGLADTADGLLPHLDRQRRLEVMAAADVGAFAVGTVVIVVLLRAGGLAALPAGWQAAAFTGGVWAGSRTLMAAVVCLVPSARPGGLAATLAGARPMAALAAGVPLAIAGALVGRGAVGAAALAAGLLTGAGVVALARRRLGGTTGDVVGAAGMVAETVALVVAAGDW